MASLKTNETAREPAGRAPTAGPAAPYPKRWAAAWVMILAALLDMIDGSIVNTALPSIGRGLHASSAQLQWTVSAYMLGFAATLIIAGHLGDRYGRKKLFLVGVAAFAAASGRLTMKMVRQPQPNRFQSVSTPPSRTPTAVEMPAMAPYRAKALPRSSPSNMVRKEARICGIRIAAMTP